MALAEPTQTLNITNDIIDFLATAPSQEDILAFKPSEAVDERGLYLLERNRDNKLTAEEQSELDEFTRINRFMMSLKARVRVKMKLKETK